LAKSLWQFSISWRQRYCTRCYTRSYCYGHCCYCSWAPLIQIVFKSITFELNIIHVVWVNTTNYNW